MNKKSKPLETIGTQIPKKKPTFIFDKAFENIDEEINEEDSISISSKSDKLPTEKNVKKASLR